MRLCAVDRYCFCTLLGLAIAVMGEDPISKANLRYTATTAYIPLLLLTSIYRGSTGLLLNQVLFGSLVDIFREDLGRDVERKPLRLMF